MTDFNNLSILKIQVKYILLGTVNKQNTVVLYTIIVKIIRVSID